MISEEKMTHIIHLILDGIESGGHVKFTEKEKKFDPEKVYKGQPNPTKV